MAESDKSVLFVLAGAEFGLVSGQAEHNKCKVKRVGRAVEG
jgi:hypothetical protein